MERRLIFSAWFRFIYLVNSFDDLLVFAKHTFPSFFSVYVQTNATTKARIHT